MFVDDLSDVLDDANSLTYTDPGLSLSGTDLTWSGELAAGATITVSYSVTINDPLLGQPLNNAILINVVSSPHDDGGCADICTTQTLIGVPGYTLEKSVDKIDVTPDGTLPNDWVTWTLTITNTGTAPYTSHNPIMIEDDLSDVLDDSVFGAVGLSPGAYAIGSTLYWSGSLAVGATIDVNYRVRINTPSEFTGGNMVMNNLVTPLNSEGICLNCTTQTLITMPDSTDPSTPDTPETGTANAVPSSLDFVTHYWYLSLAVITSIGGVVWIWVRRKARA